MLHELNFTHIAQTEAEFFASVIEPHAREFVAVTRHTDHSGETVLLDVAKAIRVAGPGTADYLLGASPIWGDVTNGYAATFSFDIELDRALADLTNGAVSVRGSAGSGKTTSLMRAAAKLAAAGNKVMWLGRENELSVSDLRTAVVDHAPDYLFIDDLDRFGGHAPTLLKGLRRSVEATVVVTATRSARFFALGYDTQLLADAHLQQTKLTDEDAVALLDQLARGKRLGALLSKSPSERIRQLTKHDDRQLLVTLIEATSGEKFHERVADECRGLSGHETVLYGIACTAAWADNKPLSAQNLVFAAGSQDRHAAVQALRRLESSRLLIKRATGYAPRHRVVAESAIDYFRDEGLIANWITDLLFLTAAHYDVSNARSTRLGRMLIRLISHDNLRALVADDLAVARIYGDAEKYLSGDPHFWLQRGSYEIDYGDLPTAKNFLEQARAIDDDDALIETAWAHLHFKWALTDVSSARSAIRAQEALDVLLPLMRHTVDSPHTFAVFLIYGLRWLKEAPMRAEEQRRLRELILELGNKGRLLHPTVPDVQESWATASKWIATNQLVPVVE
jgi:hypothetical protein